MNNLNQTNYYAAFHKSASSSLIILEKPNAPIKIVPLGGSMKIGRRSEGSDAAIQLDSSIASRAHGVFTVFGSECYYTDTKSLNGTYINGNKLEQYDANGSRQVRLQNGDILRIDRRTLDNPHPDAVTMIYSTTFDPKSHWEKRVIAAGTIISIGRNDSNGIVLPEKTVSREHARIFRDVRTGVPVIQNCGSTNGVLVNNIQVSGYMELHERNVIRICDTLIFVIDGMLVYNTSHVGGSGLVVDIKETNVGSKTLISGIHLEIHPGDFVLVLGGSGAGKSTLVNSILGKYKINGNVSLRGNSGNADRSIRDMMAYVPQTLAIRKEEKLKDVITDTAITRCKTRMSAAARDKLVMDTLNSLGLASKANTPVKNLSGGEQRRASIANEAVTNPEIFFLDEPDSGLDPRTGYELMGNLRSFANEGKIVMLISHNYASYPNPERIYSKMVVLAKSERDGEGKLAFFGTIPEALEFFGVTGLIDITHLINPRAEGGEGRADEFVEKYNRRSAR